MKTQIILSGHGGFSEIGYTKVPEKCYLHFYTDHATLLTRSQEDKILSRLSAPDGIKFKPRNTFTPLTMCRDYYLRFQGKAWTAAARNKLNEGKVAYGDFDSKFLSIKTKKEGDMLLSEFFAIIKAGQPEEYDIHWMACREHSAGYSSDEAAISAMENPRYNKRGKLNRKPNSAKPGRTVQTWYV